MLEVSQRSFCITSEKIKVLTRTYLGHAPGALGYERLEDTGVDTDADGEAAVAAAALKGDGLVVPGCRRGPLALLTGVTLVRPKLLTPLLLQR